MSQPSASNALPQAESGPFDLLTTEQHSKMEGVELSFRGFLPMPLDEADLVQTATPQQRQVVQQWCSKLVCVNDSQNRAYGAVLVQNRQPSSLAANVLHLTRLFTCRCGHLRHHGLTVVLQHILLLHVPTSEVPRARAVATIQCTTTASPSYGDAPGPRTSNKHSHVSNRGALPMRFPAAPSSQRLPDTSTSAVVAAMAAAEAYGAVDQAAWKGFLWAYAGTTASAGSHAGSTAEPAHAVAMHRRDVEGDAEMRSVPYTELNSHAASMRAFLGSEMAANHLTSATRSLLAVNFMDAPPKAWVQLQSELRTMTQCLDAASRAERAMAQRWEEECRRTSALEQRVDFLTRERDILRTLKDANDTAKRQLAQLHGWRATAAAEDSYSDCYDVATAASAAAASSSELNQRDR
jgi:hypothetical protein